MRKRVAHGVTHVLPFDGTCEDGIRRIIVSGEEEIKVMSPALKHHGSNRGGTALQNSPGSPGVEEAVGKHDVGERVWGSGLS